MIVMLALRGVPSIAMQGTGGTIGMGDEYNLSNLEKGNIYAAWGWAYTIGQMPGGAYAQLHGAKQTWLYFMGLSGISALLIPIGGAVGGFVVLCAAVALGVYMKKIKKQKQIVKETKKVDVDAPVTAYGGAQPTAYPPAMPVGSWT